MNAQEEEYVTLFCEGDGGVYITGVGYPKVTFGQKTRDVLDYIDSLTKGGCLYQDKKGHWRLVFNGLSCISLLEVFSRHVVGKAFLDNLNGALEYVGMFPAVQHALTLNGFVAFWDAEGGSSNMPQISVSQKDREILDLVVGMFGGGITLRNDSTHQWYLNGEQARTLYSTTLEKSHCPEKAEELCKHFEGPNYYELNKDKIKICHDAYNVFHKDEQQAYRDAHRAETKARNDAYYTKQKAIREWMKLHPEVVRGLEAKT